MSFVVVIDRIGQDGLPTGQPIVRTAFSETEAMAIMRGAAQDAEKAQQRMLFSLYDHSKRLLMSYTCRDRDLAPLDAFAP